MRSGQLIFSPAGPAAGLRHTVQRTAIIYKTIPINPGIKPAAKSSRMLVSVNRP